MINKQLLEEYDILVVEENIHTYIHTYIHTRKSIGTLESAPLYIILLGPL